MNIEKIFKLFKHFIGGDTIDIEGLKLTPTTIEKGEIGRQQNGYLVNFELSNPKDISYFTPIVKDELSIITDEFREYTNQKLYVGLYNNVKRGLYLNEELKGKIQKVFDDLPYISFMMSKHVATSKYVVPVEYKIYGVSEGITYNWEEDYYWIRNKYNSLSIADKNDVIGSAMFIFLNKTCFRGLFRVGPNGFNVPYGNYKNPEIINKNHLDIIHDLIKDVIFTCCDFRESMINIEDGDFLYLDPPYVPEKNTSFVGYNKCGFDIANHNELFAIIHTLKENNVKMAMSNSDIELIRDVFSANEYNYTIETLVCKRSINSKNPDSKTKEVIIRNY